ncbi:twin-arginine translocase TatA/TatE family subunit [Paracoccus sp. S1E-3]|uniref:twin-arginine translocase TatA/TatE family subunit n=1 Tax=Paracoccus sp. S1E-3 TaxID=2756130 RepID=UPI0015EF5C8A|nr:twin-arginine translocase TatA/TatE family subunit [Paracoccus sp. S1E-3]MBA4492067.1 twin-arginine translocase TatA/TatE family subunit [Paracoccus sp. S1E-3]
MLNNIGLPGLLLIAVVVLVLFGRGKVSSLMGEVGKGINAFKQGVKEGSEEVKDAGRELTDETKREEAKREEARRDAALRDVTPEDHNRV